MFDLLPWNQLVPLAVGLGGYMMRLKAQRQAFEAENLQLAIKALQASTVSADAAVARGGIWMRRLIVVTVFFTIFGGIGFTAYTQGWVNLVHVTPVKEHLMGLFSTGGKQKVLTLQGLVLTPEMWELAKNIGAFYFGQAVARVKK
jgi:hypothetical protein